MTHLSDNLDLPEILVDEEECFIVKPKKLKIDPAQSTNASTRYPRFSTSEFLPSKPTTVNGSIKEAQQLIHKPIAQLKKITSVDDKNWINRKKIRCEFDTEHAEGYKLKKIIERNTSSNTPESLVLTDEQKEIISTVLQGKNVFFTGCAGTGKSTVLRELISVLPRYSTFITASTGIAAINIGGITLHSFAGIGLGEGTKADLAENIQNSSHKFWWERAKALIIDEISMVDAELFEKLEFIARFTRKSSKPFGGIQLVFSGDFFQLPPVSKDVDMKDRKFCFQSPLWKKCIDVTIELKQVFRQSEENFVNMLNEIRHGICTEETTKLLEKCKLNQLDLCKGIEPTRLYPHNRDVDEENNIQLNRIPEKGKLYIAKDSGRSPFLQSLQSHCPAPAELKIKVGAQVLLVKNLSMRKGLVNGTRGVVVGFDDTNKGYPRVLFTNSEERTIEPDKWRVYVAGDEVACRQQIPLKLAWAMSIHKCQGSTITLAEMSLSKVFEYGQAYVALSRVSSFQGLKLLDFSPGNIRAHPEVIDFYSSFSAFSAGFSKTRLPSSTLSSFTTIDTVDILPYKAEYALSGRSICKECNQKIDKDLLRFAKVVLMKALERYVPLWFHVECYPTKKNQLPKETKEIDGFESLRVQDQEKLVRMFHLKRSEKTVQVISNEYPQLQTAIALKCTSDEDESLITDRYSTGTALPTIIHTKKIEGTTNDRQKEEEARKKKEQNEWQIELIRRSREAEEMRLQLQQQLQTEKIVKQHEKMPEPLRVDLFTSWKLGAFELQHALKRYAHS